MRSSLKILAFAVIFSGSMVNICAAPTVVFPNARELRSPDGRFLLRNAEREAPSTDFAGTFHSLWLVDVASGSSRKLCDYVGVAAARWSDNEHLVITEYLGKKNSRALLFSLARAEESVTLDRNAIISLIPAQSRTILRDSDRVFVEGVGVEQGVLALTIWGSGKDVKRSFRWHCNYDVREHSITCAEERRSP
jgi:hypothetical protein